MFKDIYLFLREIKGVKLPPLEAFLKKKIFVPRPQERLGIYTGSFLVVDVVWVCLKMVI
jgi:hypothetical protein